MKTSFPLFLLKESIASGAKVKCWEWNFIATNFRYLKLTFYNPSTGVDAKLKGWEWHFIATKFRHSTLTFYNVKKGEMLTKIAYRIEHFSALNLGFCAIWELLVVVCTPPLQLLLGINVKKGEMLTKIAYRIEHFSALNLGFCAIWELLVVVCTPPLQLLLGILGGRLRMPKFKAVSLFGFWR